MTWSKEVRVGEDLIVSNAGPLTLIAGVNVVESRELVHQVAEVLVEVCSRHDIRLVFKASWDKANRSSIESYRGPGLAEGLSVLTSIRDTFSVPVVTDVHSEDHVQRVADVADLVQIPAFLCRQTDLLQAACETGRPLLIKKMQMMSPAEMNNILEKCHRFGGEQVILCERGTSFGYHNLVVDPLSFPKLKELGAPVAFDVTHALQRPGGRGTSTDGQGRFAEPLAVAGVSQGIAALFLECHPNPASALCDGPCALPLDEADALIGRLVDLDRLVKSWPDVGE